MIKIGLISDTHGTFDEPLQEFLSGVDQIWHAGDIGSLELADRIAAFKPLRAVCGNIDGGVMRRVWKPFELFECERMRVLMTHIGGYPDHYDKAALDMILRHRPAIFVAGHSHILKIIYDKKLSLLHLNPGAAGRYGFHGVRTALRFAVDGSRVLDMEIWQQPRTGE